MSPVPIMEEASAESYIIRKDSYESTTSVDSCQSISSVDSLDNKKSYLQIPTIGVDSYFDVSDHCYQSGFSDSDQGDGAADVDGTKEDSGVEADQGGADFIPPDKELTEKIIQQVEFYFSDANITKDAFLLKHVRRNKEGYVSLKLIASFKRVKHICKDWQVVTHALKSSTKLQINESGTKLRRIDPLPEYDETTPSRTVIAINLPSEKPSVESVAEIFRKCGDIALIRVLRPGNPIPNDVRQFVSKHAELGNGVCALVEFEASESARKAVNMMNDKENWRSMQVFELSKPAKKAPKKAQAKKNTDIEKPAGNKSQRQHLSSESSEKSTPDDSKRQRQRKKKNRIDSLRRDSGSDRSESDFSIRSHTPDIPSLSSSPLTSPLHRNVPQRSSPIPTPDNGRRKNTVSDSPPWTSRRRANSALNSTLSASAPVFTKRTVETNKTLLSNVIRMPRGPDGSRGFNLIRLRSISAPIELPPVFTACY